MSSPEPDEGSRLYSPCSSLLSQFDEGELVTTCDSECGGRFYARCCLHTRKVCHHGRVVYTDGACMHNGRSGAVAGIGIAFGTDQDDAEGYSSYQFSIPVDDRIDPHGRRTSQRAELLAALEGLKTVCEHDEQRLAGTGGRYWHWESEALEPSVIIITTDSEYVVKGMTEWLPNWKRNDLRKSDGQRPSNLDLFLKLDSEVNERERKHGCEVQFWRIDREYNTLADQLAKQGARIARDA